MSVRAALNRSTATEVMGSVMSFMVDYVPAPQTPTVCVITVCVIANVQSNRSIKPTANAQRSATNGLCSCKCSGVDAGERASALLNELSTTCSSPGK